MAGYGYTIPISYHKNGNTTVMVDSSQIEKINSILRKQFDYPRYGSDLDHLMLFSTEFYNFTKKTYYNCVYVISLEKINHKLFLNDDQLDDLLDNHTKICSTKGAVYARFPSFRFNKFHVGNFFSLDESKKIVMNLPETNARGAFAKTF